MIWALSLLAILGVTYGGCPPADSIGPLCTCRDYLDAMMTCRDVLSGEELLKPFHSVASLKYKIFSLQISNSSFSFLPNSLFDGCSFQKIRFYNSQIMSLSDSDIAFEGLEDSLEELRATEGHYTAQWDWQQLRKLRKLQLIDINMIQLGSVSEPFPPLKSLIALGIMGAGIGYIHPRAFADLSELIILNLKDNQISSVKRSMLPSKLSFLDFSNNELSVLPKDLFQNLPHLVHVALGNNRLTALPEDTFQWPMQNLESLFLLGNQLVCDCRMRWIKGRRIPIEFYVKCAKPDSLAGKDLRSVKYQELIC
ncbi:uncharacterized protein CDAR_448511 [Caerostris darwini]|uniref:Uncharacterized protein n=1 Tax=Caerostris darwini TaxID=1538125 RepID=A0AAV4QM29_9ARAC|nr:uncharacterized protein CDAR_448511 [Caerostris darwini]